jgi:hypothetical protein
LRRLATGSLQMVSVVKFHCNFGFCAVLFELCGAMDYLFPQRLD